MSSGAHVVSGVAAVDLPAAVGRSEWLFFHAAIYGNFAKNSAMLAALDTVLSRPSGCLEVISLDAQAPLCWRDEFFAVLREDVFPGDMAVLCRESDVFLADLADRYPGRVRRYAARTLPLAPIIITDDRIFAGQYLHGPVPAPHGLWMVVPAPVRRLRRLAEAGMPPDPRDRDEAAAYRLVRECVAAREAARPI